jgi:large subunit ribosomal protein L21
LRDHPAVWRFGASPFSPSGLAIRGVVGTLLGLFLRRFAVYAIIEDRGTQMRVAKGDVLDIDLVPGEEPKTLTFDRVLAIGDAASGEAATIGAPYISGATVKAEVLEPVRGDKLDVIMYKRRKGQRRKMGHRQGYLRIRITDIKS